MEHEPPTEIIGAAALRRWLKISKTKYEAMLSEHIIEPLPLFVAITEKKQRKHLRFSKAAIKQRLQP